MEWAVVVQILMTSMLVISSVISSAMFFELGRLQEDHKEAKTFNIILSYRLKKQSLVLKRK